MVLVGDCRRSEIDAEITSGSDREVDGSTFDHRFFRECLAWDNAGKRKKLLLCISAVFYLVPVIYAAVLTYFPDPRECWLQMIAAGLYVTVLTSMSCNVLQNVCIVGISFVFLAFCSVQLGEQMEPMKKRRWGISDDQTICERACNPESRRDVECMECRQADKKRSTDEKGRAKGRVRKEERKTQAKIPQTEQNMIPEETGMDSSGGMEDLRELGALSPGRGCVVHCDAGGNADRYDLCFGEIWKKEYDRGSCREGSATDPSKCIFCSIHPL